MHPTPTPTREQAACLDDRAEWPHLVPQWATPDGGQRYVILRALSAAQKRDAERAATVRGPDRAWGIDDWLLMGEEVRRGIVSPPDLPLSVVMGWNHAVVLDIYDALQASGGYAAARVAAALETIAGPPPPPAGAARAADADIDGGGDDGGAADGGAPGDAAGAAA